MTVEERVDAMCKWNNPCLHHLVIETMKAAIEEEREDCAQLMDREAEGFQVLIDHAPTPIRAEDLKRVKHSIETVAKQIRARSEKGK